jgi:hypothetical protein
LAPIVAILRRLASHNAAISGRYRVEPGWRRIQSDDAEFPYKDPHVRAIEAAFDAMLRRWVEVEASLDD